jgi:hypothetical protein
MRSAGFRIVALLCVFVMLFATVLPPGGGVTAILLAAAPVFGVPAPSAIQCIAEDEFAPDRAVAACVPARAPPLA